MHLISSHPARRVEQFILVVLLPLLVGCGGGNEIFVSAPPSPTINLNSLTEANQLQVDNLFAKLNGANSNGAESNGDTNRWITIIDSDSLNLKLDSMGDDTAIGTILRKLPPISTYNTDTVTNQYSRFGTISATTNHQIDIPARLVVWGHQASALPDQDVTYQITSLWNCVACDGVFETDTGRAAGRLNLILDSKSASLNLDGDGLSLNAPMLLDEQIQFQSNGNMQLVFNGIEQKLNKQFVSGTLFGLDASEAGIVLGLETAQGALFSIMSLGRIIPP